MNSNFRLENSKTEDFRLRNLVEQLVGHWYWFIISVLAALGIALIVLKVMPRTYKLSALIMVDSRNKMSGSNSATSTLLDPSIMPDNTNNAEKTVQVLRSARLIRDVVRRLKLDQSYSLKERFGHTDLYPLSPIAVDFTGNNVSASDFLITPEGKNSYSISDVSLGGSDISYSLTAALGDTVQTPMGALVVRRSDNTGAPHFTAPVLLNRAAVDSVAALYRDHISVDVDNERAEVIRISLIENNYRKTEDFINTLIAVYNEYTLQDKNKAAENTANFIRERVGIIGVELGDVDKEIEQFKKSNNLTSIEGEAKLYMNHQGEYKTGASDINTQIGLAEHMAEFLSNPKNKNELLPANSGAGDNGLAQLVMSYNQALTTRNKLIENSSTESPAVKDLNVSLGTARTTLIKSFENLKYSLWAQLRGINAQQQSANGHLKQLPEQERGLLTISRQQQIKEQLYLYLLQKREENALNLALTTSNIRVIDYADGSRKPVSPNKWRILSMAFMIGLVIPVAVIYLLQQLNTRVRSKKDIEVHTTIPIIGEIPQGDKSRALQVVTHEPGADEISEAFRIIRSDLRFVLPSPSERVIMVTSTQSGEGKTFISFNLAMSLALTNQRILLINTDIRKKGDSPRSFSNGNNGLTNYLAGTETDVTKIIKKGELHPNLDTIGSGPLPPNPAELLMSERLDRLIGILRKEYDYIILDNVPMRQVADAVIVSRVIDLTIYVIREGVLDRRMLPEIQKFHHTARLKNMVILVNGCRHSSNWGYGYGYGYGYGSAKNGSEKTNHKQKHTSLS